jgi:hypothetical protein
VFTVFEGRLGAVDEGLIAERRLLRLTSADDVVLTKRHSGEEPPERVRRDPSLLVDLLAAPSPTPWRG